MEILRGGVMPDIEYFYELVSWVRTADRKYLSNYYFLQNTLLSKAIEQAEITYHYREKEYLVLWYQKEQFKRMYYFIADAGHYKISNDSDEIYVCDIICRDPDSSEAGRILSRAGMRKHAVYMKWLCRSPVYLNMQSPSDLQIVYEDDGDLFKEKLYLYFDELSDLLPDKREWDTFLKEKHFIGVHDIDRGALAAGMVYSKSGSVITEDFIFVTPAYQGKGISKLLHYALYEKYAADKVRYIAWIRTDNIKSIGLHSFFKYQRQEQFKITFRS